MTCGSLLTTLIQVEVGDLRESHLLEQAGPLCSKRRLRRMAVDLIGENGDRIVPMACFGQAIRLPCPVTLHGWHRLCT